LERAVEIKMPREFIKILGLKDIKSLEKHSRIILAAELYMAGKVSLGRAAELADIPYDDFWGFLKESGHKIRVGPKTLEEAEKEYEKAKERLRK